MGNKHSYTNPIEKSNIIDKPTKITTIIKIEDTLEKLEKREKIIVGYKAILNPESIGYNLLVFVKIKCIQMFLLHCLKMKEAYKRMFCII